MEKVVLKVEGMHCGSCAVAVQMALSNTPGVSKASVSFEQKKAEVEFDPKKTGLEQLLKAIDSMGYRASKA